MNNISIRAVISVIITLAAITGQAQITPAATGVKRTDLQQHDLSIPGREAIQVRVDIAPGVLAPAHKHPGEEIIYVLEGALEYQVEGQQPVTLRAGQVLFIPYGKIHSAKNVGSDNASELATYIVEKGKPLVVPGATTLPSNSDSTQSAPAIGTQTSGEIRPFHVHVADADLADLRQRVQATRWPDKETVTDQSQGIQLADLQELVRYWGTSYDWRKAEARLNALPQFTTTIDGVDIYFIHVRSRHKNALPMILTHGWPGSVFEFLKVIGPLTDPTAYGGNAGDAFDLVIPSIPGYGFSGKPTGTGWDPDHIARAWAELMRRLGYTRYVAQGGDWGSPITNALARQAPAGLLGIHINLPATVPSDVTAALATGSPAPAGLSDQERAVFNALDTYNKMGSRSYAIMMGARPQTIGYAVEDSPAGLAAWLLGHPGFAHWTYGRDPEKAPSKDDVLDDFTLYWLTNSATSAGRLYWENGTRSIISATAQKTAEVTLPVAITVFPEDIYRAPETWARRAYPNLAYFHEVNRGGHFASWEQPQLFAEEIRSAFRSLHSPRSDK